MKNAILTFAAALALCMSQPFAANSANVTIWLKGYNPSEHKNFVDILLPDVNYPVKEQIKISDEGKISYTVLVSKPRMLMLLYDDQEFPIIISPDDQVSLTCNIADLLDFGKSIDAVFSGSHAESNTLIFKHLRQINHWTEGDFTAIAADKTMPENDYKKMRLAELNSQLAKLDQLIIDQKISDTLFIQWAKTEIKYFAGQDLCAFPFIGRKNTCLTSDYFDFVSLFEHKNDLITTFHPYTDYLSFLTLDLRNISAISVEYTEERDRLAKSSLGYFPIHFNLIKRIAKGTQRELMLIHAFKTGKNIPPAYFDSLQRYTSPEQIAKLNVESEIAHISIVDLLQQYPISEAEKKPLLDLYAATSNKIVYHDLWFDGCPSCMLEMPHYNDLIQSSDSTKVVFVFLCTNTSEQRWKSILAKYSLKGKHILLNKNQVAFYERYFELIAYPHHHIVDSKGMISNWHLPHLSPDSKSSILEILGKVK